MSLMFFSFLAVDAYVTMYCYYSREAIIDVIHAHLEYIFAQITCKGSDSIPCVLNVVRYDNVVSRWMLQKLSLTSNLEKTVVPLSLCMVSCRVGDFVVFLVDGFI